MNNCRISLILLFLLVILNLRGQSIDESPLNVNFELIATSYCNDWNDHSLNGETYSSMYGQITLTNITDSSISFWIMNCSWTDLFILDSDSIMLAVSECDNNYSKLINLRKDHSIVFNSIIDIPTNYFVESLNKTHQSYYESQSGPEYNTFKIGFIFISKNEFNPLTQTLRNLAAIKRKDGKVIWSELINIEYSVYKWHSE